MDLKVNDSVRFFSNGKRGKITKLIPTGHNPQAYVEVDGEFHTGYEVEFISRPRIVKAKK